MAEATAPAPPDLAERRRTLEAEFCTTFTEKARLDELAKAAHDTLMRLQGRLEELRRLEG